jgi:hypothetical protein
VQVSVAAQLSLAPEQPPQQRQALASVMGQAPEQAQLPAQVLELPQVPA